MSTKTLKYTHYLLKYIWKYLVFWIRNPYLGSIQSRESSFFKSGNAMLETFSKNCAKYHIPTTTYKKCDT